MNVTFPTRPTHDDHNRINAPGTPTRAIACHCDRGFLMDQPAETCVRCGHYNQATISQTWADRARKLAQHPQQQLRVAA